MSFGFAVRNTVLKELFSSPEWKQKFDKCETFAEIQTVVEEFCIEKGYKIKEVDPDAQASAHNPDKM